MTEFEMILRLVLALVLGAFIGVERIHAGKSAGIRTLGLVALGSALFTIISEDVVAGYPGLDVDPLRVGAQIVTGIGFLGAGMIIFKQDHLSNLTTAAGVWVAAGIGMSVGFGMYGVGIAVTILVIITFSLMLNLEIYVKRLFNKNNHSQKNDLTESAMK
jgi:putative Mg2+ transporter-C (MgtC) family protein